MLKDQGTTAPNGSGCSSNWSRDFDTCLSAACVVYCRADSVYLCSGCDARVHAANRVASRHERVWVCDACERAPAAFLCKADAASLCSPCDADIHSANPLASRHHRVRVLPLSGCVLVGEEDHHGCEVEEEEDGGGGDEAEAASWLLLNDPVKNDDANESNGFLFCSEVDDEYLDLVDCDNSCGENNNQLGTVRYGDDVDHEQQQQCNYRCVPQKSCAVVDSLVPVQNLQVQQFQPGFEFESSKAAFSYNGSVSQSVSISSMDVGIVPKSTVSDVSISHSKPPNSMVDLFFGPPIQMPSYLTPVDREARVLRYREKKKTRKFEKKIRYASRKAYAETKPREKGRFAKRTNVEAEVDQMLSSTLMTEAGYSVVSSF